MRVIEASELVAADIFAGAEKDVRRIVFGGVASAKFSATLRNSSATSRRCGVPTVGP